jgi:flagellum-specific peptidoglycan hydrolase FlgJ
MTLQMTPPAFIALLLAPAQATQATTGIPASFTLAQAALESAWNGSLQAQRDFNLFGVKADANWHGEIGMWPTREYIDGKSVMQNCAFRKYLNLTAGLEDHAAFLTGNPRYRPAFAHVDDSRAFARAVAQAGYATDPHYAEALIAIIDAHQLQQYDLQKGSLQKGSLQNHSLQEHTNE